MQGAHDPRLWHMLAAQIVEGRRKLQEKNND